VRMDHGRLIAFAASAACLGLAGCGGAPHTLASSRVASCGSRDVKLALTAAISPQTGEHGRVFALRNVSDHACVLDGSPRASLYERGRRMPFVYRYPAGRGGNLYVSGEPPRPVQLDPGAAAYFVMAKYRCDSGVLGEASGVRVALPGQRGSHTIRLPPQAGVSAFEYCRHDPGLRTSDPGNRVDISAIVASASAGLNAGR
jgi:Domain of unknown function (DUF4232)